ncbi:MAG: hypothetical protein LUE17_13405 [Planctomycetaceae bacterium]|nr:hypothetical protein [Planctomycetaceae bacterium]
MPAHDPLGPHEPFRRLAALYQALDDDLAAHGATCRGCGECCRFDRVDHILYASDLEREYLLGIGPPPPVPPDDADLVRRGLRCPYQSGGACLARAGRVLGCRLHFCEGLGEVDLQEMGEGWHDRVKFLHAELGIPWNYRPLLPL